MIDLHSKRKLSYYSDFETPGIKVLELMEGILALSLIIPLILKITFLMKTGPILMLFPLLILLWIPPSSRVSCLVWM